MCIQLGVLFMLEKKAPSIRACEASLIFIGLMFLLPFVSMYHRLPILTFYAEWIAAAFGFVAIALAFGAASWRKSLAKFEQTPLKIPQSSFIFVGLAAVLCMQWALGMLHSSQYALLILSYLAWAFLLVLLGSYLRRKLGLEKLVTTLAWYLVIAGIINVCIVILQFVTRTGGAISLLANWSGYGTLSQANHFANFIALATASLIYLYAKSRFSLSFFALMLGCFLATLSSSGSRSAWLYLAAFTAVAIVMLIHAKKQNTCSTEINNIFRASLMLIPAFTVVQLLIYYVTPNDLVNLPTERLVDAAGVTTPSARLQIWYDCIRLFLQSPWLGVGAGTMRAETFLLLDQPSALGFNRVFEHGHNLFLHLLAEMGAGAFLTVLIGLSFWIKYFKWSKLNLEGWWLTSLLAVLSIHSMLEYPLWYAYFLGIFAILLGAGDEKFISISLPKIVSKSVRAGLIIALLLGTLNLTTLLIANIKIENWILQFAHNNTNDKTQLDWVRQHSVLSPYADLANAMSLTVNLSNFDYKVRLSQSVLRFKPLPKISYQHVLLLKLQGDDINAKKYLNRALIAYPKNHKEILEIIPLEHRQIYLDLLSEVQTNQKSKI